MDLLQRSPSYRGRRTTYVVLGSMLAWTVLAPLSAKSEVVGYTHTGGLLFVLDLRRDSAPIEPELVGWTGLGGVGALAIGPDGSLYAAAVPAHSSGQLWRIDPTTLAATQVGELGISSRFIGSDLTADADGGLWLVTDGRLYSVDRFTGHATPAPEVAESLAAVAHRDGILYGIAHGIEPRQWWLVTIDPASGELFPLTDLDIAGSIAGLGAILAGVTAMDFDDSGGLWVLVEYLYGQVDPLLPLVELYYFSDLQSGSATSRSLISDNILFEESFAVAAPPGTAAVPALDSRGIVVFAVALAVAMFYLVSRRRAVP